MKEISKYFIPFLLSLTLASCGATHRIMYTNLDNTGSLFLSHYTSFFPSLGSCGFRRAEDDYVIVTPRITGRIASSELRIDNFASTQEKYSYLGCIEFLKDDKVYVELYRTLGGVKTKLSINGTHKIKVEPNMIGNRKV
jgi:hypothetical protein